GGAKDFPDRVAVAVVRLADRQGARAGRFHNNSSPPRSKTSSTRCQVKFRYWLACPKQPQLTSSPRALATILVTTKTIMSPVTMNTAPRKRTRVIKASPERISSQGK